MKSPARALCATLLLSMLVLPLCGEPSKEIEQADLAFCQATAERGLDGWMSYLAPNATIVQADSPVRGTAALRQHYEPLFARRNLDFRWAREIRGPSLPAGLATLRAGTGCHSSPRIARASPVLAVTS